MTNFKFKVGDKVVRNKNEPEAGYFFGGIFNVKARIGDVFEISSRGVYEDRHIYSVKGAYIKEPNWNDMEKNFDLFRILSWKDKIGGV
jgi:hypothetical protein